ncbi:MAG: four helix bundle protein [Planctomycetes bacterium]|nr:four helix bundle protein [Planctomycetota bacterium]
MQRFQNLEVWQRGHKLTLEVYRLSRGFPADERFGLTSQIRRSVSSVPTNIAEGSKRAKPNDYARFLNIAESSLAETEYQRMLATDLGFATEEETGPLLADVTLLAKKLYSLRRRVEGS